jgi:AraC family transcriptional regulator
MPRPIEAIPSGVLARAWGSPPDGDTGPLGGTTLSAAAWRFAPCHQRVIAPMDAHLICVGLSDARRHGLRVDERDAGSGDSPAGSLRIVPPGAAARVDVEAAGSQPCFRLLHLYAPSSAFAQAGLADRPSLACPGPGHVDPWLATLVRRLASPDDPPTAIEAGYLGLAALAHIVARYGERAEATPAKGGLAAWQLKRVLEAIEADLAGELTLAELATVCRLSPFHFARAFRRSTGQPPHAYVTHRRITRAKDLLADQGASVIDVAATVGYDNPGHFAKVFRRSTGVTPSGYRRKLTG